MKITIEKVENITIEFGDEVLASLIGGLLKNAKIVSTDFEVKHEEPIQADVAEVEPSKPANTAVTEKTKIEDYQLPFGGDKQVENKPSKFDRHAIEAEVKRIANADPSRVKSMSIKAVVETYGVEKMTDIPDDKMIEFLEKVKAL